MNTALLTRLRDASSPAGTPTVGEMFALIREAADALEAQRATLHPEQIADLAARCGVKGSAAALAEFAALVREAEPMAPDEMRPAPAVNKQGDLEEALACVLSEHTNLSTDGIDDCVPRMVGVIPAAALPFTIVPTEGIDPALYSRPDAGIIGYVEPGHIQNLRENQREGCYIKLYAVPFTEASARPTVPLYATTAAPIENAEYLSKRLARVAKLAGVHMPEYFTHEQIAEIAPTILGEIARNLERTANPQPGATNMLKLPLTLNPAARGEPATCEVRDAAGRVLGTGFTPLEGSEAILRVNIHTELVSALRQARDALLNHVDVRVVAPAVERVEGVLGKAGAM